MRDFVGGLGRGTGKVRPGTPASFSGRGRQVRVLGLTNRRRRGRQRVSMSLKMTGQMDWQDYATYSQYHPDNLKKPPLVFADHVKAPAPLATLTEIDKKVFGAWGHALCCEPAYGKNETCTRLKERVTPKVGQTWDKIIRIERGKSISQTAMYGGSLREMSFEEIVEARGKKG